MSWLIVLVAVAGAVLNIKKRWQGFLLWLISNGYWYLISIDAGRGPEAVLFLFFWFLSLTGLVQWRKKEKAGQASKTKISRGLQDAKIYIEILSTNIKNIRNDHRDCLTVMEELIKAGDEVQDGADQVKITDLVEQAREITSRPRPLEIKRQCRTEENA